MVMYANGKQGGVREFDSLRGHVMENAQASVELVIAARMWVRPPPSPIGSE